MGASFYFPLPATIVCNYKLRAAANPNLFPTYSWGISRLISFIISLSVLARLTINAGFATSESSQHYIRYSHLSS